MVVFFWLDWWKIFYFTTLGFELGTSGSLVLHSTTGPLWPLVFTSDNFRYLTLVQRDWWWYSSDWTCERFSFTHTGIWTGDLWISSPALYHCAMVTSGFHLWQFQVFNSGAEGLVVVFFWLDLWEIFFSPTLGFELGTAGSLVLHSTTVPWWLLVFTSDNFRYLTLVQRDWWWYSSDWTCERFSFHHTGIWTGDLWISSPALYHCAMVTSGFHLWQFQVFNSGAEGLVVVFFWLDLWEIFFFTNTGIWTGDLWISSPALYHCAMVTSGFHLWQFQVFNSGAEGLVVVFFWLDLWEIFFLPHWDLNWGPLDL